MARTCRWKAHGLPSPPPHAMRPCGARCSRTRTGLAAPARCHGQPPAPSTHVQRGGRPLLPLPYRQKSEPRRALPGFSSVLAHREDRDCPHMAARIVQAAAVERLRRLCGCRAASLREEACSGAASGSDDAPEQGSTRGHRADPMTAALSGARTGAGAAVGELAACCQLQAARTGERLTHVEPLGTRRGTGRCPRWLTQKAPDPWAPHD